MNSTHFTQYLQAMSSSQLCQLCNLSWVRSFPLTSLSLAACSLGLLPIYECFLEALSTDWADIATGGTSKKNCLGWQSCELAPLMWFCALCRWCLFCPAGVHHACLQSIPLLLLKYLWEHRKSREMWDCCGSFRHWCGHRMRCAYKQCEPWRRSK